MRKIFLISALILMNLAGYSQFNYKFNYQAVVIFPNPFTSSIEIVSASTINKPNFQLQDVLGRTISFRATEIENGRHWKIETGTLNAGNYWLTITSSNKSSCFALLCSTN